MHAVGVVIPFSVKASDVPIHIRYRYGSVRYQVKHDSRVRQRTVRDDMDSYFYIRYNAELQKHNGAGK